MMRVLISNMIASRVNLLQNDYAAGLPSPTAFLGLGSSILHDLGFGRWDVSVLPILHEVFVSDGRTKPGQIAKAGRFANSEIPEDLLGTVRFSLFLDIPQERDLSDIAESMRGKRIAGGVIFADKKNKPVTIEKVANDGACFYRSTRGRALVPSVRADLEGSTTFGDAGGFTALRDALCVRASEENPSPGYRVPVAIGYRLLTQPGEHPHPKGTRSDRIAHVFGEPGAGVAELVSVRNPDLTGLIDEEIQGIFWRWSVSKNHITAHPHYNPDTKV